MIAFHVGEPVDAGRGARVDVDGERVWLDAALYEDGSGGLRPQAEDDQADQRIGDIRRRHRSRSRRVVRR